MRPKRMLSVSPIIPGLTPGVSTTLPFGLTDPGRQPGVQDHPGLRAGFMHPRTYARGSCILGLTPGVHASSGLRPGLVHPRAYARGWNYSALSTPLATGAARLTARA